MYVIHVMHFMHVMQVMHVRHVMHEMLAVKAHQKSTSFHVGDVILIFPFGYLFGSRTASKTGFRFGSVALSLLAVFCLGYLMAVGTLNNWLTASAFIAIPYNPSCFH